MPNIIESVMRRLRSPTAKNFGSGGWFSAGMYGTNADMPDGKGGAAIAYASNIAAYRAANVRANAVGNLAWRIVDSDGQEIDHSDADCQTTLGRALQDAYMQQGASLFESFERGRCLYGEAFLEVTRANEEFPVKLAWLDPVAMSVNYLGLTVKNYRFTQNGLTITYDPDEVMFYREYNPNNPLRGLSPVEVALDTIRIDDNAKRFLRAHYRNSTRGGMVIKPTAGRTMTEEQMQDLKQMNQQAQGTDNAGRGVLIPFEADIVLIDPADISKNIEMMREIKFQIYTALGVSPAIAGDSDSSRYQASPQERPNFYINTVYPAAGSIEKWVNARLMPLFEPHSGYVFQFDMSQFSEMDEAQARVSEQARMGYEGGIITLNEAREKWGLDAMPDGDILKLPPDTAAPFEFPMMSYGTPATLALSATATPPMPDEAKPDAVGKAYTADTPEKYRHIDFTPPDGVRVAAKRALGWIADGKAGDGFTDTGRKRASDLARADYIPSPEVVRRMHSFFSRHAVDKEAEGFSSGEDGYPSAGRVAWDSWGGDAGASYADDRVERMNAADDDKTTTAKAAKAAQQSAQDELATFRKFAMKNGGDKAQRFECRCLAAPTAAAIKTRLLGLVDKRAIKVVFDDVQQELSAATLDTEPFMTDEAVAQTLSVFEELARLYPDLGFDGLIPEDEPDAIHDSA